MKRAISPEGALRQRRPLPQVDGHRSPPERFWASVAQGGPDDCWLWQGKVNKRRMGYGVLKWRTKEKRAHRVAYELTHGAIPDGMMVLHKCDTPPCCNPSHLFLGTAADNCRDACAKGRAKFDHLPHGHNKGERNGMARLTRAQVDRIKAFVPKKRGDLAALAREMGVSQGTIARARSGETWGWL